MGIKAVLTVTNAYLCYSNSGASERSIMQMVSSHNGSHKEPNMNTKPIKLLAAAIGLAALSGTAAANGTVSFGFYVGAPAPVYAAPVYYPPRVVYAPPAPVYYGPPAWGVRYGYRQRWEHDRRWGHDHHR